MLGSLTATQGLSGDGGKLSGFVLKIGWLILQPKFPVNIPSIAFSLCVSVISKLWLNATDIGSAHEKIVIKDRGRIKQFSLAFKIFLPLIVPPFIVNRLSLR